MSDRPTTESADAESQKHAAAESVLASKPAPLPRGSRPSPMPMYIALAVAVIAAALAGLAYFHPAHNKAAGPIQQSGDAKANVCSAYAAAHKAVVINTHLQSQNPDLQLAIAANARLALVGGGSYLQDRLAANAAASADLANAANSFANSIQQLGLNYLTDAAPDVQDPLRKNLDAQIAQLDKMCA